MEIKGKVVKNNVNYKTTPEVLTLIEQKLDFYKNIVQKTYTYIQYNKNNNILTVSDVGSCIDKLNKINENINTFLNNSLDTTMLTNKTIK